MRRLAKSTKYLKPPAASTAEVAIIIAKISNKILIGGELRGRPKIKYKTLRPMAEKRPKLIPPFLVPASIQMITMLSSIAIKISLPLSSYY